MRHALNIDIRIKRYVKLTEVCLTSFKLISAKLIFYFINTMLAFNGDKNIASKTVWLLSWTDTWHLSKHTWRKGWDAGWHIRWYHLVKPLTALMPGLPCQVIMLVIFSPSAVKLFTWEHRGLQLVCLVWWSRSIYEDDLAVVRVGRPQTLFWSITNVAYIPL